jgi:Domain of unknown function (DUF4266)
MSGALKTVITGSWQACIVLLAMWQTGCANVKPWQRGALADPVMQLDRDALGKQMAEHMWFSREAASGGRGVGGGGCGCN